MSLRSSSPGRARSSTPPRRYLVAAFGDPGHVFPAIALGRALAARGAEVTVETWEERRAAVEGAGPLPVTVKMSTGIDDDHLTYLDAGRIAAVREAGAPEADLTVVVVNATGCESTAILLTASGGTILFYSMATAFGTAALSADGMSRDVRMIIGNGFAPDRGAYALLVGFCLIMAGWLLRSAQRGALPAAAPAS